MKPCGCDKYLTFNINLFKFYGLFLLAGVAELVDARDLKSLGYFYPCRFDSGPRHRIITFIEGD